MNRRTCPLLRPAIAVLALFVLAASCPVHAAWWRKAPPRLPSPASDSPELHAPIDPDNLDLTRLAAALFHETNRVRHRLKLPLYAWNPLLDRAADLQASSSALSRTAGHTHLLPALATPWDRVKHVGLEASMVGENALLIAVLDVPQDHGISINHVNDEKVFVDGRSGRPIAPHTYASFAVAALEAWMSSPPHRETLMNPDFRYVGCGGRSTKSINGLDLIAAIQVFFTPATERPKPDPHSSKRIGRLRNSAPTRQFVR